MKFVHLTPRKNIALIKRNGIRRGTGRRGKGVYAMPLIMLSRDIDLRPREIDGKEIVSAPISASRFWTRLFSINSQRWGTKAAAIVFSMPEHGWPVRLYIGLPSDVGIGVLDWMKKDPGRLRLVSEDDFYKCKEAFAKGWGAEVEMKVDSARLLGGLLHAYRASGGSAVCFDDIELVIDTPIPSSCIERIVPLYQRNKEFRVKRAGNRFNEHDGPI